MGGTFEVTHHGGDCFGDGEFGNEFVFSYIMVVKSKESETQAINKFYNAN